MDISKARFVDVDGINTRYFDKGEGRTVVLFHGGNFGSPHGADCAADWNLNFDGLAQDFRVIAVDEVKLSVAVFYPVVTDDGSR